MSKKPESKSAAAVSESRAKNSVFDFLYHDSRRIASFLAQLDELGHLQQITQSNQASEGEGESTKTTGNLGFPGVAGGKLEKGVEASSSHTETSQRVYDPFWANAIRFLDLLTERGMIQRNIEAARIGQFTLATGALVISDNAMLRAIWDHPSVGGFLKAQELAKAAAAEEAAEPQLVNRQQRRTEHSKGKRSGKNEPQAISESDLALAMLPHMPHAGQMHVVTDDFAVWASAADGAMVAPMPELILKHGQKVAGQWSILGILDALPFEQGEMLTPLEQVRVGMTMESVSSIALNMAPFIRQALGRPLLSYGVTPLLVFREVSG